MFLLKSPYGCFHHTAFIKPVQGQGFLCLGACGSIVIIMADVKSSGLIIVISCIEILFTACHEIFHCQTIFHFSHISPAAIINLFADTAILLIYRNSFFRCNIISSIPCSSQKSGSCLHIFHLDFSRFFSCSPVIQKKIFLVFTDGCNGIPGNVYHTVIVGDYLMTGQGVFFLSRGSII